MVEFTHYQEYLDLLDIENSEIRRGHAALDANSVFDTAKGELRSEKAFRRASEVFMEVVLAKIVQLLGNRFFGKRAVSKKGEFESSPRTIAKTAQELLTGDTELQAFTREDIAEHGEEAVIRNIVVDPRRITDTFLRNTGFDEFIPTGKKMSQSEKMRFRAWAIPSIKDFFANGIEPISYRHEELLQPEDRGYFRLFRITQGKNEGRMLGVQESNGGERLFLTDVHSAFRRIDHIEASYAEETGKLNGIRQILRTIIARVGSGWDEVKESTELEEMKAELARLVESLKFVKNEHKVKMKDKIERCLTFRDKRSRMNPGSRLAILASVNDAIGRRIHEAGRILSYLAKDRVRVQDVIMEQAHILSDFHDNVEKYYDQLALLDAGKKINPVARQKIITNLSVLKTQCESFTFEPYLKLAKRVILEIDAIIDILNSDNLDDGTGRESAKKSFVTVYVVSKLLKLEMDLVNLREEFFKPGQKLENVYVKSLIGRVQDIHNAFSAKNIAPETRVKEFGDIFGHVYALLGGIKRTAQQSLRDGAPEKQRVEALAQINAMLRAFDPYEKLKGQQLSLGEHTS